MLIIQLINYLDNYSHLFIYIDKFSFIFIHSFIYSFKYNCLQLVTSGYTRVDKSLSVHVEKRSTRRMFIQINTCHNTMHRKYRHWFSYAVYGIQDIKMYQYLFVFFIPLCNSEFEIDIAKVGNPWGSSFHEKIGKLYNHFFFPFHSFA